jgi:hypothetical protein
LDEVLGAVSASGPSSQPNQYFKFYCLTYSSVEDGVRPPGFREWEEAPPSGTTLGELWLQGHLYRFAFPFLRALCKCRTIENSVSEINERDHQPSCQSTVEPSSPMCLISLSASPTPLDSPETDGRDSQAAGGHHPTVLICQEPEIQSVTVFHLCEKGSSSYKLVNSGPLTTYF